MVEGDVLAAVNQFVNNLLLELRKERIVIAQTARYAYRRMRFLIRNGAKSSKYMLSLSEVLSISAIDKRLPDNIWRQYQGNGNEIHI